jgi:transcriptional regulator with XRE-family HTH domain
MNYGRAFKIARALSGLEQRELAKLADIDPSHLSLIEHHRSKIVVTLDIKSFFPSISNFQIFSFGKTCSTALQK